MIEQNPRRGNKKMERKAGKIVSTIKNHGSKSDNNGRLIRVFFTDSDKHTRNACMRLERLEHLSRYINIVEIKVI